LRRIRKINQEKILNFGNGYISYIKENVVKNKFWKYAWNTFIDKEENCTWEYFCLLHCGAFLPRLFLGLK
jgi:hypothetical protein